MPILLTISARYSSADLTAKEFIQYLFSDKVQASQNLDGFPVNAHSLESWSNMETAEGDYLLINQNADISIVKHFNNLLQFNSISF